MKAYLRTVFGETKFSVWDLQTKSESLSRAAWKPQKYGLAAGNLYI